MPKLPHLGARIFKSGIVVFLCCFLLPLILKRNDMLFACIAGIMCIQTNIEDSVNAGTQRLIGTFTGALTGLVFTFVGSHFETNTLLSALIASIGIILTIYICSIFSLYAAINVSCVVFLSIFISVGESLWYTYTFNRMMDTLLGVLIGVNVNKYLFKKSFKKANKKKS